MAIHLSALFRWAHHHLESLADGEMIKYVWKWGAGNPEAGESSKAKLIGFPLGSQPARLSIVISLFSDTHTRVSEMLAQIFWVEIYFLANI